ncbi:hypothetical protein CPB83DRAFT_651833 [Crepidotus variabilis]|uniref:Uncharacterized protein n=1 Tax=Crepidotus variabilis TaxID=179855 RepID=A0A9P6E7C4_9AGAR|nr:hypothetical protein CPB83DRAFT_651833 [Crepidotus variabilis]
MFTVSRTPVSETWLSTTPSMTVGGKRLESSKTIAMNRSRMSTTSINSELFPELLSWSAIIDFTQRSAALPQPIPSDVTEEDETDISTVDERRTSASLSQIFDPTTLAIGFDISCLDGLDDRLIYTPKESFVDWCWSECVGTPPSETAKVVEECRTPTPSTLKVKLDRRSLFDWSSDESSSDSDECATARGSEDMDTVEFGEAVHLRSPYPIADLPPYESLYWNPKVKPIISLPFERHNVPDPNDSVGYFPMPHQQPKKLPRRLTSLLQFGKRQMA